MTESSSLLREAPLGLEQIQRPVNPELDAVLDEIRRIVRPGFAPIEEVGDYLVEMRGKFFRPTLLLLADRVDGEPSEDAVSLAAVVELVHLATLVHDDAVDHSVLRRGQPTVNALWTHQVAIIMGDYLYSRSVMELSRLGNLEAVRALARASNDMSQGEMRQLTSHDALDFTEEDYYALIACKTASLMAAACEMGALSADETYREPLRRFGHNLGMAFQIADDLLDYTGVEEVTGKPSGQDLRERKVTLPLVEALRRATPDQKEEIRRFFSRVDPTDDEIATIVAVVQEVGGLEYARAAAHTYGERAREALSDLPPGSEAVESLRTAVSYAVERSR